MRLDKFLKVSRIVKRRTIANNICDAGKVTVNGKAAKASQQIKISDIIEISIGSSMNKFKVMKINEHTTKETASENYIIL